MLRGLSISRVAPNGRKPARCSMDLSNDLVIGYLGVHRSKFLIQNNWEVDSQHEATEIMNVTGEWDDATNHA